MSQLSRHTIAEYLPVVKGICASIEVETARHNLDNLLQLQPLPATEQYGRSNVIYAMLLIGEWLRDTPFSTQAYFLQKKDRDTKWADMLDILNAKILEYHNDVPIVVLNLHRDGYITRTVDGSVLKHNFEDDKFKKRILFILLENTGYTTTRDIQTRLGSKSTESVSKTIAGINNILRIKLQLPRTQPLIENKRPSGYRLNPLYNIVVTN